jgi:transposase
MDIHKNARLSFRSREILAYRVVKQALTLKAAAAAFNVTPKTAAKWVLRYRVQGVDGLYDRSSRPHRSPRRLPDAVIEHVVHLRRHHTPGYEIARRTAISPASISRILRRVRLSRWRDLHPAPPVVRYEHAAPGDLLHLDIKGMTRFQQVSWRAGAANTSIPAGKLSTSPSTTTPAWLSPRSCPIRRPIPPSLFCTMLLTSSLATASAFAPCSPTMAAVIAPISFAALAS